MVTNETNRSQYVGNGSTTTFNIGFTARQASHVSVLVNNTEISQGTGSGEYGIDIDAGTITTVDTYTASDTITILRSVPFTQPTDLVNNQIFDAEVLESALDNVVEQNQQQQELLDRTVTVPPTDGTELNLQLPSIADRSGNYLAFDGSGNIIAAPGAASAAAITAAYEADDDAIIADYEAADTAIISDYEAADTAIQSQLDTLEGEYDTEHTAGLHTAGAAMIYVSETEPTTRPDGATSLDSSDVGRVWFKPSTSKISYYTSTGWQTSLGTGSLSNVSTGGIQSVSEDYTITGRSDAPSINVTTGSSDRTITLPAGENMLAGDRFTVRKVDSGTGKVIVSRASTDTIDGVTSVDVDSQYDYATVEWTGSYWSLFGYNDHGSGSNGSWARYADGTLVQQHELTGNYDIAVSSGLIVADWTFPVPFVDTIYRIGITHTTATPFANDIRDEPLPYHRTSQKTTTVAQVGFIANVGTFKGDDEASFEVVAHGRWRA